MNQRKHSPLKATSIGLATALLATSSGFAFVAPASAGSNITPIASIQGTGESVAITTTVTTQGVVTASYNTGNFQGFVIQTSGTGAEKKTEGASDAIFVYTKKTDNPAVGTFVEVTGTPAEYQGLSQISNPTWKALTDVPFSAPTPIALDYPRNDQEREAFESMLVAPVGSFTVSNTYDTSKYGEVGLAVGNEPLWQPTDVARPSTPEADKVAQDNAARGVILDDGSTINFTSSANKSLTPPYISLEQPVRVGASVTFNEPMILDYRNNAWKFNPTRHTVAGDEVAGFKNTRTQAPSKENIGRSDFTVASFNVLNYFTQGGEGLADCTSYKDRDNNPITVNSCPGNGPRGAWNAENLKRQQDKLVSAINQTDASVVGLMEIENSAVLGRTADQATETLVDALNAAAGAEKWAYSPSATDLPQLSEQDVISNAIIFQKDEVTPLGAAKALGDLSGAGEPFANAREPLGQAFTPKADGAEPIFVAVNHFKSKGSAGPLAGDEDKGDGQGSSNASRVAQATALVEWIPQALDAVKNETGTEVQDVALVGDFNSYTEEDPMHVLYNAGYTDAVKAQGKGEATYSYDGLAGSLDHVLYNESLKDRVTGADVWEINSPESIALEYSRYNNHGTLFYAPDAYRSSDHDPVVLGLRYKSPQITTLNILDINDFHGRIDENTVKFAGTIEESRKKHGEDQTLFVSAGDNIGASLFASAVAKDTPTIKVLNELGLATSVVGNHEFDQGLVDLEGRVNDESDFNYLGANVYLKGTQRPVLKEFEVFEVDGVRVGVIGAVTQETPTLVTPAGIADLDFGDPVDAVNRVAAKLTDGRAKNGEADVLVALYHEGAGSGAPENSTLANEIAEGGAFAKIVTETDSEVDAIFTGHTHKQYAWMASNGAKVDRPVIQTGNYGEFIGQALLKVDVGAKEVIGAEANTIARTKAANEDLIAEYPRVANVDKIVHEALDAANEVGKQPVGSLTADITRAFSGGTFVDGKYTGGKADDRGQASALGTLVANSLRETLASTERGGAQIGVVNPGGMRTELLYGDDGVITYAEANSVLPFVNNLWTTKLTGAQVKTMLEQQWQTNADGSIPSRSYLQLGVSDNVSYTFDSSRAAGDRITSVTVDGKAIDPAATYTIGTFSFLATGGDNFRVFKEGTGTKDSGLVDREGWIEYLKNHPELAPNFARAGVEVSQFPAAASAGDKISLTVNSLDTFSQGAPANTELTAKWTGGTLSSPVNAGKAAVTDGAATIEVSVPAEAAGATTLVLLANNTKAQASLPISVAHKPAPEPLAKAHITAKYSKSTVTYPSTAKLTVSVSSKSVAPTGKVAIYSGTKKIASGTVKPGKGSTSTATISLPKLKPGKYKFVVRYLGDKKVAAAKANAATLVVKKQPSSTKVAVTNKGRTIAVTVKGKLVPSGKVTVRVQGKTYTKTLSKGKAVIKTSALKKGKSTISVSYKGNDWTASSSKSVKVTVR